MKKKSILLTCIVAIMALAMFVGCDSTPVFPDMPKSVKGGYLTQTGVILTGQEVTADKFTLTVEYDNGDEPTVMPATNIQLDGTGNVFAVAGLDSDNNPVDTEKLLVAFTDANRIEATGFKESYTVAEAKAIKPSDIQVTAYYGTEGSVALTSSEFVVKVVDESALDNLVSPSNPTAQVEVVVRALVGVEGANQAASNVLDEKYVITVNYEEPVETEYAIEELTAVAFAPEYVLKALNYDEVPVPTLDDVIFNGKYDNGEAFWGQKLPADTEIALSFVDSTRKLDLIEKNLVGDESKGYEVKAIYNDEVVPFVGNPIYPAKVEVIVETVEGFEVPIFKEGDKFVSPVSEDYDVILEINDSTYERLDAAAKENVVFSYGTVGTVFTPAEKFIEGNKLAVQAEYMGVKGHTTCFTVVGAADPVPEISSITADFKSNIKAPAAMEAYDDIDSALAIKPADILDSITLHMTEGADDVVVPASQFGNNVIALWTTEAYRYVPVVGDGIAEGEEFYILVRYTAEDGKSYDAYSGDTPIVASTAVATGLNVEVTYTDTLNDDGVTPMMGTTATLTVEAVNDLGVVKTLSEASSSFVDEEEGYRVDNGVTTTFNTTVSDEEETYTISAFVNGVRLEDQVTVLAGRGYVKFDSSSDPTVSLSEDYVALIDSPISAITAEDLVISNLAEDSTDDYAISIKAIQSSTKTVEATGNTILAIVEWLTSDGSYDEKTVTVTFEGVEYVEPAASGFAITFDGKEYPANDFPVSLNEFAVADFDVAESSYTKHGTVDNPSITKIVVGDREYTSGSSISLTVPGIQLEVVVSYIDGINEKAVEETVLLTTGSTTTLQ